MDEQNTQKYAFVPHLWVTPEDSLVENTNPTH